MAISWGGASGGVRLGIEAVRVAQTATHETWEARLWLWRDYTSTWDQTGQARWSVAGSITGSGVARLNAGGAQQTLLWSGQGTFERQYGYSSQGSVSASITQFSRWYPGSSSTSFNLDPRPYSPPAVVQGVSAVRVKDSQIRLSFNAPSSAGAPVDKTSVDRSVNGGAFSHLVDVTGNGSRVYTDTTVSAGNYYRYRFRSAGGGGWASDFAYSADVYMTPSAPSLPRASKVGANIEINWVNEAVGAYQTRIYGGANLLATLGEGETSYTVLAPTATQPHRYQLAHFAGGLESRKSTTNEIKLASAPFAPSNLSPNGTPVPKTNQIELSWSYNSSDSSAQTKYEIQVSNNRGSSWKTVTTRTGTASTYTYTIGNSEVWRLWRVRTWGQDGSKPSPWSSSALLRTLTPPGTSITVPSTNQVVASNTMTARFKATGVTGTHWQASILDTADKVVFSRSGTYHNNESLWYISGLENNTQYKLSVKSGSEVWGTPAVTSFQVQYPSPAKPVLTGIFREESGSVQISITNPPANYTPAKNRLERWDNGSWLLVEQNLAPNATVVDFVPPLSEATRYRVVVTSTLGTESYSDALLIDTRSNSVYLNWGIKGAKALRLQWDLVVNTQPARIYSSQVVFAGHTRPSLIAGSAQKFTTSLKATLGRTGYQDIPPVLEALHELALSDTPVTLRRSDYRALTGFISSLSTPRSVRGKYTVSLKHIETADKVLQ